MQSPESPNSQEEFNIEAGPNPDQIVLLLGANERQRAHFSERIEHSKGVVRIFVHPAFGILHDMSGEVSDEEFRKYRDGSGATFDVMSKMLTMSPDKTPPIILMEESPMVAGMSTWMMQMNEQSGNELYVVATEQNQPVPAIPSREDPNKNVDAGEAWRLYAAFLKYHGVKKVILAGGAAKYNELSQQQLDEYGEELKTVMGKFHDYRKQKGAENTDYMPDFCLGNSIIHLSQCFDVEISNFTFPDTLADLKKIEASQSE